MGIGDIYKQLCLISPRVEVSLRKLYWNIINKFGKFNPNTKRVSVGDISCRHVNFEKILDWLRRHGVSKGDLLIVHSGYGELEATGLEPDEIIDRLLDLIGPTGTLCMPVIREFKGSPKGAGLLLEDTSDLICSYDVKKTKVASGMLPFFLMQRPEAEISSHPLNPMCAIGPLAKQMMEHNLDGTYPSPHGKGSSWKFCLDQGAKICFIGTDLEHHNTITHVAEEAFDDWHWSNKEWYQIRKFNIIDKDGNSQYKEVYERKPKWGMLHYAEINVNHDLKKNHIVKTDMIDGLIHVGFEDSQEFIAFLRSKNKKGYPYA